MTTIACHGLPLLAMATMATMACPCSPLFALSNSRNSNQVPVAATAVE